MSEVCQICHKQLSRYTCPTCNAPYCSLACFKDPNHSGCSERFYHQSLVSDIQASKETSKNDKAALFDMVKRLEDIEEPLAASTQEHEELARKLQGLDIDALDVEGLQQLLTPEQLDRFQHLVDSGDVGALLAAETQQQPWWCAEPHQIYQDLASYLDACPELPPWNAAHTGEALMFNLVAVALAYVYLYRTFVELDASTVMSNLSLIAPFLVDKSSTLSLKSANEAVFYILTRTDTVQDKPASAALIDDLIKLLQPQPVAPISQDSDESTSAKVIAKASHHNAKLLGALCHLHSSVESDRSKAATLVRHKLKFYMALATSQTPAVALPQMRQSCIKLERVEKDFERDDPTDRNRAQLLVKDEASSRPANEAIASASPQQSGRIVELS